jgi:hypothetical protein
MIFPINHKQEKYRIKGERLLMNEDQQIRSLSNRN